MNRILSCSVLVIIAMVAVTSGALANPPTTVSGTWPTPFRLYVDTGACAFMPYADAQQAAATSSLTAAYSGSEKFVRRYGQFTKSNVTTTLSGMIQDANGHPYSVSGTFTDKTMTIQPSDLRFDGTGSATLSGSSGTVSGAATFRYVTGPDEYQLTFTSMTTCTF